VRLSLMSVITLLAPASSALLAWALLDERLVVVQIIGMAVTVGALALMVRSAQAAPA
jgi:drug/metabolite transporter (DMT)-like permease